MKPHLLCLLMIVPMCRQLYSQEKIPTQLVDKYVATYMDSVFNQSSIFYGKEANNYLSIQNRPYLKDSKYHVKGYLSYNGIIYPNVFLRLDIFQDKLSVLSPDRHFDVILSPKKVDFAKFHNYQVIYFRSDSLPGCPSPGFYLLLHSGKYTVLEKQSVTFKAKENRFTPPTVKYYLCKDGKYFNINSKKSLLKALGTHKKDLTRHIRNSGLRFKKNAEYLIIDVIREYEKLCD